MKLGAAALIAAAVQSASAIKLTLTTEDIERALAIGRDRERERAQFHAPYIHTITDPTLQSVEVITEFRRIVLLAEERILKGDRGFAYSSRIAEQTAQPWKGRVSVVARLRFHPFNTYVAIPEIEVAIDGPRGAEARIGVLKDPIYALASGKQGERVPLMGAVAEAVFESAVIGQTVRTATIKLDGKELGRISLDFAAVE
jgi:hypothetical protein